jgi:Lipocalin-like domain
MFPIEMYTKSRPIEITKFRKNTFFSLFVFLLIPLSSCKDQIKSKVDVTTYPDRTSIPQKFVGKWRQYYSYSNGASPVISEYVFNSDGTFVDLTSYRIGEKSSLPGKYQVNGNILKMIYTTNSNPKTSGTKEYPFTFEDVRFASDGSGEATRYLFLTEPGQTAPSRYQKVKLK